MWTRGAPKGSARVQQMVRGVEPRVADDVMPVAGTTRVVVWSGNQFVVTQPPSTFASADCWGLSLAVDRCGIRRIEVESTMRSSTRL